MEEELDSTDVWVNKWWRSPFPDILEHGTDGTRDGTHELEESLTESKPISPVKYLFLAVTSMTMRAKLVTTL